MDRNGYRWIVLLGLIIINCAHPLAMQGNSRFSQPDRVHIEETLRRVDNSHRTLPTKNFTSHIRRLIGTPYRYGGNSTSGLDCSGFINVLFEKAFNRTLPRSTEKLYSTRYHRSS
jgi:cell wall-associated NlpC family hydrolase